MKSPGTECNATSKIRLKKIVVCGFSCWSFNFLFIVLIILLLAFDLGRHFLHWDFIPLPPLFSIEIGILLVSIKIIWMISRQSKVDHFQFWILNSIEFRLNNLSREINDVQASIETLKGKIPGISE